MASKGERESGGEELDGVLAEGIEVKASEPVPGPGSVVTAKEDSGDYEYKEVPVFLPVGSDGRMLLDGRKVVHVGSCGLHEEGVTWANPKFRKHVKPKRVPNHAGCAYYEVSYEDFTRRPTDGIVVYTPTEKILYKVL